VPQFVLSNDDNPNTNPAAKIDTINSAATVTAPNVNAPNVNTPNVNTPSHTNIFNIPTHVNPIANVDTFADTNTPGNNNGTAIKSRKRKSDDNLDLVLPDGIRRSRKQKSRPDENFQVTKRGKKKEPVRK
jgi:hypothetical protein